MTVTIPSSRILNISGSNLAHFTQAITAETCDPHEFSSRWLFERTFPGKTGGEVG